MMPQRTGGDMFSRVFPGEQYSLTFEPTEEQSLAVTELAAHYATDDADQDQLLMALGLLPYESAVNPSGRDTWLQKDKTCRRGHRRSEYTYVTPSGQRQCRACRKHVNAEHRAARRAAREAAKEAAA